MNPIRHLIVAGSLLCASLLPTGAHAAPTPASATDGAGLVAVPSGAAVENRGVSGSGAVLSSGLLALGSANDPNQEPSQEARLAQREQAAPELRDFRGGRVYVYLGGGATLLLVLLLVLILL